MNWGNSGIYIYITCNTIYKIIITIYILLYRLLRKVFRCGPVSMFMKLQNIWMHLSLTDIAAKVYTIHNTYISSSRVFLFKYIYLYIIYLYR